MERKITKSLGQVWYGKITKIQTVRFVCEFQKLNSLCQCDKLCDAQQTVHCDSSVDR